MPKINTEFLHDAEVSVGGRFSDGSIALVAQEPDEPVAERLSVCVPGLRDRTDREDVAAIRDYAEMEGVYDALHQAGVIGEPLFHVPSGFVEIPVCPVLIQ